MKSSFGIKFPADSAPTGNSRLYSGELSSFGTVTTLVRCPKEPTHCPATLARIFSRPAILGIAEFNRIDELADSAQHPVKARLLLLPSDLVMCCLNLSRCFLSALASPESLPNWQSRNSERCAMKTASLPIWSSATLRPRFPRASRQL